MRNFRITTSNRRFV